MKKKHFKINLKLGRKRENSIKIPFLSGSEVIFVRNCMNKKIEAICQHAFLKFLRFQLMNSDY